MPTTEELLADPVKMEEWRQREKREPTKMKREEVLSRARILRSVPGSGYHDNDSSGPVKALSEEDRRSAKIDEHCIAFKGKFETCFIGDCADRVFAAIQSFASKNKELLATSGLDQESRTLIETAIEYADNAITSDGFLIRNAQWNNVLAILHFEGLGITSTAV